MKSYRVKKLYDQDGKHIGYSRPRVISQNVYLHKGEEIMMGDIPSKYGKVVKIDGEWTIVEDTARRSLKEQRQTAREAAIAKIRAIKKTDLSNATSRTDAIMDLIKVIEDLI